VKKLLPDVFQVVGEQLPYIKSNKTENWKPKQCKLLDEFLAMHAQKALEQHRLIKQ